MHALTRTGPGTTRLKPIEAPASEGARGLVLRAKVLCSHAGICHTRASCRVPSVCRASAMAYPVPARRADCPTARTPRRRPSRASRGKAPRSSPTAASAPKYIIIYNIPRGCLHFWLAARRSAKVAPSKRQEPLSSKGLALASLQRAVRKMTTDFLAASGKERPSKVAISTTGPGCSQLSSDGDGDDDESGREHAVASVAAAARVPNCGGSCCPSPCPSLSPSSSRSLPASQPSLKPEICTGSVDLANHAARHDHLKQGIRTRSRALGGLPASRPARQPGLEHQASE